MDVTLIDFDDRQDDKNSAMDVEDDRQPEVIGSWGDAMHTDDVPEECVRLRAKIQRLQSDAEAKQNALDDIIALLTGTQEALDGTKSKLAAKESECAALRAQLEQARREGHHDAPALSSLERERSPYPGPPVTPRKTPSSGPGPHEADQQQIDELMGHLRIRDESLRAAELKLTEERATRKHVAQELQGAQAQMAAQTQEKEQLAALLRTAEERAQVQAQDARAASQCAAEVDQYKSKVDDLQKQVKFFRDNSARTSRKVHELVDENERLNEDLSAMQKQLKYKKSMDQALKRLMKSV
ncbi:hypothetical protein SPI_07242 [Niveomyces insectorum RCEF 264]|uniref:Uncharacterized protein n=1 Tax=Niveomyces insectorum RCEF 264 TaxID=1081102 RepID=A0A167QF35_9HYPO|nr:hypothetical protein SPI_07242 [Niveomyces insectorum RCEF 264]